MRKVLLVACSVFVCSVIFGMIFVPKEYLVELSYFLVGLFFVLMIIILLFFFFKKNSKGSDPLPSEMTVGGITYEFVAFLREGEKMVNGDTVVERAEEMNAHLGPVDGKHLLKYQRDIPEILKNKVYFVFTDWYFSGNPPDLCCIYCLGDFWVEDRKCVDEYFLGDAQLLRRKK